MLFEPIPATEEEQEIPETAVMAGFRFDYKNNAFVMDAGSPAEVTGVEAVKEWIQLVVRTAQKRYAIYPSNFGARAQDLVGKKVGGTPKGLDLSELRRQLLESSKHLKAIRGISRMTYEDGAIHCTVELETEVGFAQEVIIIEP